MIEYTAAPDGLSAPNGFSHAVRVSGEQILVSGQLPIDAGGTLVGDDGDAQARQVFANIDIALRAAGAGPEHLVRLGFYLTNLGDLAAVRAARDDYLGDRPRPASTLVQVAGLVVPGARIEIDALAVR